jgi:DNA-binding transcriptional MocR family regulator
VSRPKIGFAPGNFFSSDATHGHCLRLTYAHYDLDRLRQGLEALATVLKECLE